MFYIQNQNIDIVDTSDYEIVVFGGKQYSQNELVEILSNLVGDMMYVETSDAGESKEIQSSDVIWKGADISFNGDQLYNVIA